MPTPRAQAGRDAVCSYEAHPEAGPASAAWFERRQGGQMQKISAGKFQCRQSRGTQQLKSQLLMQSSRQLGYELMPFWL